MKERLHGADNFFLFPMAGLSMLVFVLCTGLPSRLKEWFLNLQRFSHSRK
jgi:hypothetical protein